MDTLLKNIWATLRGLKSGGFTNVVKLTGVQVGVDGAAYGSGDVIGDKSPIEVELVRGDWESGILHSVVVHDLSKQSAALDVVVFDSRPSATTFTDNAALDIADADLPKVIGVVSVTATDYAAFNDNSVATKTAISLPIKNNSGTTKCWVAFVSRGTPTYVADELSVSFGVLQD